MTAITTYTRRTEEPVEREVYTVDELLRCLQEAGAGYEVSVELIDSEGRRQKFVAHYAGETTGLRR